jgi:hypothetical protein
MGSKAMQAQEDIMQQVCSSLGVSGDCQRSTENQTPMPVV